MYIIKANQIFIFLILISYSIGHSQDIENLKKIDSLSYLEYNELFKHVNIEDTINSILSIKAYLRKAKREKDTLRQAIAYRNLYIFNRLKSDNFYADSIISITKNKHYKNYPKYGYFFKGIKLYNDGNYKNALDYFIEARKSAEQEDIDVENYIAILKSRLGYNEEALTIYRKVMKFYEKDGLVKGKLGAYYNMSDVTRLIKQTDSSLYYCDLGLQLATEINNKAYQAAFLFNKGATLSDIGKYHESQTYLFKALPVLKERKNNPNTTISHFFIGRNYKHLHNPSKAIYHLKKMDSLFLKTKDIYPELREGYEILVNYYKDKNDLHNQLAYVQRMLVIDSIINKNFHYLDTKLIKEYNRVQLKAERKQINAKIKSIENNYLYKIVTGIIFIIVLIILLILKHLKHKKYKQKFKILMRQLESSDNDSLSQKEKEDLTKKNIGIKPDLITELICKLENFEKEHGFLDPNINRSILAKKMNTNLVYLSKIINYHRGKTFVNYINDLRVDYAIQQLKSSDKIFINWSIEAIAKEVGFKNAEPFSKAFFRKTGIKPSFFIKSLKKTD